MPLPGHVRIGIVEGRDHARDTGADHRVGARRRLAFMRTGLERHIERGAARGLAGALQRLRFRMRASARLRPAATEDFAVFHNDRANGGIGPGIAEPAAAQRQRQVHETCVFRLGHYCFRGAGRGGSSSDDNSPSTASKSLASRKLR